MNALTYQEKTYPLSEWLTYPRYAEKHGLPVPTVHQRVKRGHIPAECLIEVPELGLKLIQDREYTIPNVGPKPKLQEKLARYRLMKQPGEPGKLIWWLVDKVNNELVIAIEAADEAEATYELNRNGFMVNAEGEITGVIL